MYRIFRGYAAEKIIANLAIKYTGCHRTFVGCSCSYWDNDAGIGKSSILSRRQSSVLNVVPLTAGKKRKRVRRSKNYTELIEVTRNSSTQKRATVSKMKVKDFNVLVNPQVTASILPKTFERGIEDTLELPILPQENFWEVKHDELLVQEVSPELAEHDLDILSEEAPATFLEINVDKNDILEKTLENCMGLPELRSLPELIFTPKSQYNDKKVMGTIYPRSKKRMLSMKKILTERAKKVEGSSKMLRREDVHKTKFSKYELAAREESFVNSLLSYTDACVNCGFLNRALNALMFYRGRGKRSDGGETFHVKDARVYEMLLQGYAAKKNLSKVEDLMKAMKEDSIIITPQCYAACFECIGRRSLASSDDNKGNPSPINQNFYAKKKLLQWQSEMLDKGITLNDLFAQTCLLSDQKMMVMESVRKIEPNFSPIWPSCPEVGYTCKLLEGLNNSENRVYSSPVSGLFTSKRLQEFSLEQLQTELKDCLEVKSVEIRGKPNETVLHLREKLAEAQEEWRKVLSNAITRDLQTLKHRSHKGFAAHKYMNLYPFLVSLNKSELVELVIQEIRKLAEGSETFSPTTNQLYRELGSRVLERYRVLWKEKTGILDKVKHLYGKYCDWFASPENGILSEKPVTCTRQAWQSLLYSHQHEGSTLNFRERNWPVSVQIGVGKFLYDILIREIRIDINICRPGNKKCHMLPAFYTLFRSQQQGKMIKEEVKPHPVLARLFRGAASDTLQFPAKCVPMLCPPIPWASVTSGGYLLTKADVIRLPLQSSMQWNRLVSCPSQQLYPSLDSLNQLGAVPWKVNKRVLDVVMEVFNTGGSSRLAIPAPPSSFASVPFPESSYKTCADDPSSNQSNENTVNIQQEKVKLHRQHLYLRRKKAEAYSLWCDMHYRLSLANHFRDRVFWLPHNMDFRGRVYPCPPHLNHLGSDVARSLLCFARGQPLGPQGLDWLKLHLVNLTGVMKHSPIKERMVYAEEKMPQILDSAENPLTGDMWWAKSEEPWQTLAACMEIDSALKAEGGPENYVCHFPVHQDGSCNGLQHYAALGRDSAGAASVSLTPSECPQDVYGVVAAMVERERQADAKLGISVAQILEGFVRRKVIKQTVMTTVYGVTRFGARLQIARQLRDIDEFPKEYVWRASSYLVGKTFGCLREMFTSTREIQDWFTECARLISQVCGRSVEWVTPLGLPVVQPYHRLTGSKRHGAADPLTAGYLKVPYGVKGNHERPNVMKQKNAFPPNFIHSIDSSHMMLTSLWCEREGLTFVSVHDCYWTHPSTVEIMNQICREQFVALHSEPILEDLSTFLVENYSFLDEDHDEELNFMDPAKKKLNEVLAQVPKKGDFDLKSVLKSIYFFS